MNVIPEPDPDEKRAVINLEFIGPAMKGDGPMDYACGSCGTVLLQWVEYKQVEGIVFKCGKCREFNEVPIAQDTN